MPAINQQNKQSYWIVALSCMFSVALAISFHDLLGHGSAFLNLASGSAGLLNGHAIFIWGMLAGAMVCFIFPRHMEKMRLGGLIALCLSGCCGVAFAISGSFVLGILGTFLCGFFMTLLVFVDYLILAKYYSDSAVIGISIASIVTKTLFTVLADYLPNDSAQIALIAVTPALIFVFTALAMINERYLSPDDHIKYGQPYANTMLVILVMSGVIFATTRMITAMGFWGTPNPLSAVSPLFVVLGCIAFIVVSYFTFVRTTNNLLLKFIPALIVLLGLYVLVFSDALPNLGVPDKDIAALVQFAELYGQLLNWSVMFLGIRTLAFAPARTFGIQCASFCVSALAWQALLLVFPDTAPIISQIILSCVFVALVIDVYFKFGKSTTYPGSALGLQSDSSSEAAQAQSNGSTDFANPENQPAGVAQQKDEALLRMAEQYELSDRERDVFFLLAQGHSRKYICNELFIANGTVATHIDRIYKKFEVHSRQELLAKVLEETSRAQHG